MDNDCEHFNVVVSQDGGEKFPLKCLDCGAYLKDYPGGEEAERTISDELRFAGVFTEFMNGHIDVNTALKNSGMGQEQFTREFLNFIPRTSIVEYVEVLGSPNRVPMVVGVEPRRESDPFEIDKVFSDPQVLTFKAKVRDVSDVFNDIISIDQEHSMIEAALIFRITFVDNTKQLVKARWI